MSLYKRFLFLIVFIVTCYSVSGQKQGLKTISKRALKSHLEYIASDKLQGRRFGTDIAGLDLAADYLVQNAKKSELKPGLPGYIQTVNIISSKPDQGNASMVIRYIKKEFNIDSELFVGLARSGEINFSGEIVFAGFGWVDEETGYNDLEGLDIKDKIVLCSAGTPIILLEESKGKTVRYNNSLERKKIDRIISEGAKGIILVSSPYDKNSTSFKRIKSRMNRGGYSLNKSDPEKNDNIVLATPDLYKILSDQQGKFKQLLLKCSKNMKPESFLMSGYIGDINISQKTTQLSGKNIIGVVEGSDPELKDECIVFMAHYDHLGVDNNGDVFNGADDNGSGTVTLMEVASAFMSLKEKPKRSIVFLWVTGEEIGLLGSEYYTLNPVFPLDKTIACVNLDMVGRVFENRDLVWKDSPKLVKDFKGLFTLSGDNWPELVEISDNACKELGLVPDKSLPSRFLRSSDHYHFYNKGVPILNYATGYHADYHKVSDEVSKINFKKMKKVAELCYLVGYEVANSDRRLH